MKPTVVPAVLAPTFEAVADAVHRVRDIAPYVQIDITDGTHVPSVTWPYGAGDPTYEEAGRLDNLGVSYELDLMIHAPEETLETVWLRTAAKRCIIHLTSTRRLGECVGMISRAGKEAYIAVVIGDNLADLEQVIRDIDGVQCMGIATVGRQGEPYDDRVHDLIRDVRRMRPDIPVAVDGGVSANTVPALMDSGVSQFAVGSALLRGDVADNFSALMRAAEGV